MQSKMLSKEGAPMPSIWKVAIMALALLSEDWKLLTFMNRA